MSPRARLVILTAVVVLSAAGAIGYVMATRSAQQDAVTNAPRVTTRSDVDTVAAMPHIVFRNTALGEGYGHVALAPLSDPNGPRALTGASCERIYMTVTRGICLSADRGLVTTYRSQIVDKDFVPTHDLPLTGLPSRARLSADGTLAATTTFVFGDSYANPGQFSTRTLVSRIGEGTSEDLETFTLVIDGQVVAPVDRNFWGVSFADDDAFLATVATGGRTWLVQGSLSQRRMTSLRGDVECPSLSPDGTRIAFKKRGDLPPGQWRLAVYDLRTGAETLLAETRSVDDQVVWLDETTVVYGLPRNTAGTASSDVWSVPADGSGTPTMLISDAWSPSVVRP